MVEVPLTSKLHILLVEDEGPKQAHVERFLSSFGSGIEVVVARSVNAALDALEEKTPDLVLLDMSLPTFDVDIERRETGGRPQGFGGTEILRSMTLLEIRSPTIVLTGYEAFPRDAGKPVDLSQLRRELASEFPHLFKGVLHFNSTFEEWKTELSKVLGELGLGLGELE